MLSSALVGEIFAAIRRLRRAPMFSVAAIALLGTGIGAVTTIYSLVDGLIVRPLPYIEAERLLGFSAVNHAKGIEQPGVSVADFRDFEARQHALSAVGAYRGDFMTWKPAGSQPIQMAGALVTENFFKVLGVAPLLGRTFSFDEFSVDAPTRAILSRRGWKKFFDEDPSVIGRVLTINGLPTTVIGVMPETIREPALVEIWKPFEREIGENMARDSRYWTVVGRLAPGASVAQIEAEAATISANLAKEYPQTNVHWAMMSAPLQELRVGRIKETLWILLAATGLLLLVACFNLANLLLSRGLRRRGEMALRLALGANRRRLLATVLLETLFLSILGGAVGVGFAWTALKVFVNAIPADFMPGANDVALSGRVLGATLFVSIISGLLASVWPALQASGAEIGGIMKDSGARAGLSRGFKKVQRMLLIVQIALTFIVLTGASLLWRSLSALNAVHPGFDLADTYEFRATPPTTQDNVLGGWALYFESLADAAKSVPGVEAAAVDASAPLNGLSLHFPYSLVGGPQEEDGVEDGIYHFISPGFFAATKMTMIAGRALDERDDEKGNRVVLVNQAMARRLSADGRVIGRKLSLVPWLSADPHEIVGVVADSLQVNLTDPAPPQLFVSQRQVTWFFSTVMVRMKPGVPVPKLALREALQKIDPSLAVEFTALKQSVARTTVQPRLLSLLFTALGALTLGFTLIGVYACINFSVAQRASEFGVRMALGATPAAIAKELGKEILQLLLVAFTLGASGAIVFSQLLRSQLYGIGVHDPLVLAAAAGGLMLATFLAASVPVTRACLISPAVALKEV